MAITLNTNIKNDTDGYLLDAKNVKGGYLSVDTLANLQSFSLSTKEAGSFAYVRENSKFYIYDGNSWQETKLYDDTEIKNIIPAEASSSNKLADKSFVNSSIATNTASFLGSYDLVLDLALLEVASNEDIAIKLNETISAKTNNDYCYVYITDSVSGKIKEYRRFKYSELESTFKYEYTLNNSSYTREQWNAINSGITADNLNSLNSHVSNSDNPHNVTKEQLGLSNVDNTSDEDKPLSKATREALDGKVDKVQGKGLSTNDFTNSFKDAVNANTTNRHSHSNKATLDKITEAFTTELKSKVDKAIQEGDSRLTNSRPASDVPSWAKASSKPTYKWGEITEKPTLLQKGNLTSTDNGVNFGTCQITNTLPIGLSDGYKYGTYISFAQTNGRFEIYAPHQGTNNEHIYVRTGWDDDRQYWEKLAFVKDIPSLSNYVTYNDLSYTLSNYALARKDNDSVYTAISTSFIGGVGSGPRTNDWEFLYRAEHRNGSGDGSNYIMEMVSNLTSDSSIYWRKKTGGNFTAFREIIDSNNIGSQSVSHATTADSAVHSNYFNSVASVAGGNTSTYPWRRLMSMGPTTNSYEDRIGTYYLSGNYHGGPWYLFRVEFRTHNSSNGDVGSFRISVIATNSNINNLAIASYSVATNGLTTSYADVFVKVNAYPRMTLTRLSASDKGIITYYNSNEGDNGSSRTEAYKDINGSGAGYASSDLHSLSTYPVVTNGVIDSKFVTIDTDQTITGYKKFSSVGIDTINGATLGNAILRQKADSGEVIIGSTVRPLRLWGNGSRPVYSTDNGVNYKDIAFTSDFGKDTFKVTRSSSHSTTNTGYWAAMLNSTQQGSPTLPSNNVWWHVISMDWNDADSPNNWVSQLALPTQNGGVPHYRRNNATNTSINSSTWHSFITDENIASQSVDKANSVKDIGNNQTTTFAYSKDELGYDNFTWLAAWNGYELRGVNKSQFATASHTHTDLNTSFVFNNSDLPEGSANLGLTTSAHKMTFYRNGISIPYQMDNANDGGILRCRGNSESNTIVELGTWDDSGAGETIQFNYYSTNSQVTPAHSVSVPKKSGTIALTSDIPGIATQSANGLMSSADKTKLDGIATGATKITVDSTLSSSSTNPVQNKAIYSAYSKVVDYNSDYYDFGEYGSWRLMRHHNLAASLDIRYGTIRIVAQDKTYSVSFGDKNFNNSNYTVVFGLYRNDRNSWFWSPLVTSKSTTGFNVYVRGNTSGDNAGTLMYIAIRSN